MKHLRRLPLSILAVLLGFFAVSLAWACNREPSEQERLTRARASAYMVKDSSLHNQFDITARGLEMFDVDTLNPDRVPEAVIYWDEVSTFRKLLRAMPIDSFVALYTAKGQNHWDPRQFLHIPEPPLPFIPQQNIDKPLAGMRIALDPGHVGGKMEYAKTMEEKYVLIHADPTNGIPEEIGFCEGNLALGTALILAEKLRAAGAEVLLTREQEGLNAFGVSFETWLDWQVNAYETYLSSRNMAINRSDSAAWRVKCAAENYIRDYELEGKDAIWWRTKATLAHVHRIPFLKAEFLERARLINAFKPHATLIIHYNVGESNNASNDGYRLGIPENYCMAFIPGSFMKGELKEPEDRVAFAAKLLTDDLARSQSLCKYVVEAHERRLGVPVMEWDERLLYLKNASLRTEAKGVFARNLQLTRLIHGTLCFGESLYQDNIVEAKQLNAKDFVLPGMTTPLPNRIREVADAYYEGLLAWVNAQ
ncbi:MAG: N-acetylmuramoyl-L-alanine amidase [Bacteroidetes bacterium]|nr:N-acetylmuramoyl-L-alanine amidase [Bacteroidota bacterium]